MKSTYLLAATCASLFAAMPATAASIISNINLSAFLWTNEVTFENVAGAAGTGVNYDSILVPPPGGVTFAERFVGQELTASPTGEFDVLSSSASPNLALQTGLPARNLSVLLYGGSQVLAGLGPHFGVDGLGNPIPVFENVGEGAIAMLFGAGLDQREVGFEIISDAGGSTTLPNGQATVDFFGRDGTHLHRETLQLSAGSVAFRLDAGVAGGIAGLSIFNNDPGGIAIDNVRYTVRNGGTVPEPGSLALTGLALVGLAAVRRRRS